MLAYIYIFLSKNTSSTSGPPPGSFQVEEVRSWAPPRKRPAAGTDLNPISDIPTYICFEKRIQKTCCSAPPWQHLEVVGVFASQWKHQRPAEK